MGVYYGGGHVLITRPQAMQQARGGGGRGERGEAGEQQIRVPGNPHSSFSSSSSSLCIRRGFDKKFCFRQRRTNNMYDIYVCRYIVHSDDRLELRAQTKIRQLSSEDVSNS
jgi:hypothetical protein